MYCCNKKFTKSIFTQNLLQDLIEPGMHYNLDEETNDSNNPTTVNDVNSSEVPVTEKPTEDSTSANVDPTSKNDHETLPESTAQPSTESYRITPTERNKNIDSSSNNSSELEPEDDLLKVSRIFQNLHIVLNRN